LQCEPDPQWFAANKDADVSLDAASDVDVTVALQFFVTKGRLALPAGSKADLLGFYDVSRGPWILYRPHEQRNSQGRGGMEGLFGAFTPARLLKRPLPEEQRPRLSVRYRYRREVYEVTVDDLAALELPGEESAVAIGPANGIAG
jgi:hypothetical protein